MVLSRSGRRASDREAVGVWRRSSGMSAYVLERRDEPDWAMVYGLEGAINGGGIDGMGVVGSNGAPDGPGEERSELEPRCAAGGELVEVLCAVDPEGFAGGNELEPAVAASFADSLGERAIR